MNYVNLFLITGVVYTGMYHKNDFRHLQYIPLKISPEWISLLLKDVVKPPVVLNIIL